MGNVEGQLDFRYNGSALQYSIDGGNTWTTVSAGTPVALDWRTNILAFLQTNVPGANFNSCMWSTDFEGAALADSGPAATTRTTGTGAAAKISTTNDGIWQLSSGGTGGIAIAPLNTPTQIANGRQNVWAIYARAKIIGTPDANSWLFIADLVGNFDIFIGMYGGASTTKIACGYTDDVDFTHIVATAQNADINGAYHDYLYVGDGTNLKAFYDLNATPIDSRAIQSNIDTGGYFIESFIKSVTTNQIVQFDKLAIYTAQP